MTTHTDRTTTNSDLRHGRSRTWTGVTFGLLAVTAFLVIAPMAQAATASPPTITLKAPYAGSTIYPSTSVSSAGCGHGKVAQNPAFSGTTGVGTFSVNARATACPGSLGDSGSASAGLTVFVPVPVYNGSNVIHVKWTLHADVASRIGGMSCALSSASYSYCYSEAYSSLYGYAYLYDATNGSYYYGLTSFAGVSAYSSLYDYCYLGNCSLNLTGNVHDSVNTAVSWWFHANGLVASHVYLLEVSWYASTSVYDSSYDAVLTAASETGHVLMSGPNLGATLDFVTIR